MRIEINNTKYEIGQWTEGRWVWPAKSDESPEDYATTIEAIQSAIDFEHEKVGIKEAERLQQIEDEVFGTEENQVINHYNKVIRS